LAQGVDAVKGPLGDGHNHTEGVVGGDGRDDGGIDDEEVVGSVDLVVGVDDSRAAAAAIIGTDLTGSYASR